MLVSFYWPSGELKVRGTFFTILFSRDLKGDILVFVLLFDLLVEDCFTEPALSKAERVRNDIFRK
jgi:hypothetical protein